MSIHDAITDHNAKSDRIVVVNVVAPHWMPDGTPAPSIMTDDQAALFLGYRGIKNPKRAIRYLVSSGQLRPSKVGRESRFLLTEILEMLHRQLNATNPVRVRTIKK